jgi:hypothetical protein
MQYSQEIQGISYMGIYFIFQYGIWMDFKCNIFYILKLMFQL